MLLVECIKGGVEFLMLLALLDILGELKKLNRK
jgi:hypothetical protein